MSAYRGGRGNNRFSSSRPTSSPPKSRGAFLNGQWHCDCDPPQPAENFRVKKDGKNHGRWFFTCQNSQEKRCGFFLWQEDAQVREEKAVLANSRTEPGKEYLLAAMAGGKVDKAERDGDAEANPAWTQQERGKRKLEPEEEREAKRRREVVTLDGSETEGEDELLPWPATAKNGARGMQTPSRQTRLATPKTKRKLPWLDYSDQEATPTKKARSPERGGQLPTPSKTKDRDTVDTGDAAQDPVFSPSKSLKEEAMAVLEKHMTVPESVKSELLPVLNRHEMKMQGVVKGRDLVRTALRTRDAKIVELQGRIAGLEAEREVLLAAIGRAREDVESGL